MVTRLLLILLLGFSNKGISQNQFGFGISSGAGSFLSKVDLNESPQHTFRAPINFFSNIQLRFESFYVTPKKFYYELDFEFNKFTFTANDRSSNTLFHPELRSGRGFTMAAGGSGNTITLCFGKVFNLTNKFNFILTSNLFISKYNTKYHKQFYNLIGTKETTSKYGVVQEVFSVFPYGPPTYNKPLITFGIGLKPQLVYGEKRLKLKLTAEINKGFRKLLEQNFRTQFISYIEPEKNATYYNSVLTRGSNIKFYLGVTYSFNKK